MCIMNIRSRIFAMICRMGIVRWGQVVRWGPWKRLYGFCYMLCQSPAQRAIEKLMGQWEFFRGRDRTGQCECFFSYLKRECVSSILKKDKKFSQRYFQKINMFNTVQDKKIMWVSFNILYDKFQIFCKFLNAFTIEIIKLVALSFL